MESLPLAGRIAGFNRQSPSSGIPLHSDGNNMWLTLQMGIHVPKEDKAWIRVGPETKHWSQMVFDSSLSKGFFSIPPPLPAVFRERPPGRPLRAS